MTDVRVGILDSGISHELEAHVDSACAFHWQPLQASVEVTSAGADQLGHGSVMAQSILQIAPEARLLVAQVFHDKWVTTPAQVAAALDWLVEQGAEVINMSLGLRTERDVLRSACERALARGVILVAASPAQGEPVYPSAYPGVVRATGDARCDTHQLSFLNSSQADFGACVRSPVEQVSGASVGTAHLSGHVAQYLSAGGSPRPADLYQGLSHQASYWGAEKRFA